MSSKMEGVALDDESSLRTRDSGGNELTNVVTGKYWTEESGKSGGASENEQTAVRIDDINISAFGQKATSVKEKISEIRDKVANFQNLEQEPREAMTARISEAHDVEEEFELLKAAAEMAFDSSHPTEFHLKQLDDQVEARKSNLVELESQWDAFRNSLEEKRRSLEETLYANEPEAREKLQKLREVKLERKSVLSEIRKREDEHSKLSLDLEKLPKVASRRSYIERVKEITKNSRKLDADIERILKETRELQLESNSIQERLHRTYAVVDEMIFREAKKDQVGRQAYRLLTSIHESFEQVSEKILATDRVRREIAQYEKKLAAISGQSLNVDKLQADLDAIIKENEFIEQHHPRDS
ncbi:coiled-coil domain-containing protein 22-like [Melia azedarach]|nr:coiled-coil domain-containing protein 22-like [Melia azedarach]